ncbi:MAG: DUF1588 domain-containing protein [Rhodobacterales bacterium]|nr:DUF1588 domain-containing protein [Rhodobacterales bacterium]
MGLSDGAQFEEGYQSVLKPVCMTCHTREGAAHVSSFILESDARPDHLEVNRAVLSDIAGLERNGTSIVLLKVLGLEDHGGGAVLAEDSLEFTLLSQFVARLDAPILSCPDEVEPTWGAGLALLTPTQTLRKAAILLPGRFPTQSELDRVELGGEDALGEVLGEMMREEAFIDRMKEVYNDHLLTDQYIGAYSGVALLDYDRYPSRYWYESAEEEVEADRRAATSKAIAPEPLELLAHILREELSYTEILTADYVMVNDYSALSYGLSGVEWPDPDEPITYAFRPEILPGVPHAGVLTTPAFLNRYPTSASNRNRHRTWAFMKKFMATDLLQFADRPIDLTMSDTHNPTLNDPQCNVCHAVMDPMAGLFQNWDEDGALNPRETGWFAEMAPPGFGDQTLPAGEQAVALSWMAHTALNDPRFAVSTVQTMLQAFTGVEIIEANTAATEDDLGLAYKAQQDFVNETATAFAEGGFDLRQVVKAVVLSRYFRANGDAGATSGDLVQAGTAHLLTPEELNRKILAATGVHWESWDGDYMTHRYRLLYGGIDSDGVTKRLVDPNGIMASIQQRMATQVACRAVPRDFVLPKNQRRLFPLVESSYAPITEDGFDIPEPTLAIRNNLVHLHGLLLGETLSVDDPEIDITYELWLDTWSDGLAAIESGEASTSLHWDCDATAWAGEYMPSELYVNADPDYLIRTWSVVLTYLLTDYRFVYE